jgi:hypothetical protein
MAFMRTNQATDHLQASLANYFGVYFQLSPVSWNPVKLWKPR